MKVEIDAWIPEIIATSLASDVENLLKAKVTAMSGTLDQVNGDGVDLWARVLQRTREKLDALHAMLRQESKCGAGSNPKHLNGGETHHVTVLHRGAGANHVDTISRPGGIEGLTESPARARRRGIAGRRSFTAFPDEA